MPENSNKSLRSIIEQHDGKIMDKWNSYIDLYESEFARFKSMTGTLVELGVQNCGSLEVCSY